MVARRAAVCNNWRMTTATTQPVTPEAGSRVDLALLWRAGALITGDANAGRVIAARVARANPRPETARESTLVASFLDAVGEWRDVTGKGCSPEPLALNEDAATLLATVRTSAGGREFERFVLRDVLRVSPRVLANALPDDDSPPVADAETAATLRAIDAFDAEPYLDAARKEIERAAARRRKLAFVQFGAFLVVVGLLVYVKIDLKKAADEEKANRVPSMVELFSNPAPDEGDDSP